MQNSFVGTVKIPEAPTVPTKPVQISKSLVSFSSVEGTNAKLGLGRWLAVSRVDWTNANNFNMKMLGASVLSICYSGGEMPVNDCPRKCLQWSRILKIFLAAQWRQRFFIIPVCTFIQSGRKAFHNQILFSSSTKFISFSKYLRFHLVVVLCHAKWANLILSLWDKVDLV